MKFFSYLWRHKFKFTFTLFASTLFLFLLIPGEDIGDLVTKKVSEATQKKVFLQFDHLDFSGLIPGLEVAASEVFISAPMVSELRIGNLTLNPSFSALTSQEPIGKIKAERIFQGDIAIEVTSGKKTDQGGPTYQMLARADRLNLAELQQLLQSPLPLRGRLNLDAKGVIDPSFSQQPDIEVILSVKKFELPSSTIDTALGPLALPDIKLGSLDLKGRLSAGQFLIESGKIGDPAQDELSGTVKGKIAFSVQNVRGIAPILGAYNLEIDLNLKKSFEDKAGFFLTLIEQYKSPLADGSRYAFRVSATSPQMPPTMGALR